MMEKLYGVPADTGLAMWVADMDFAPPACVQQRGRSAWPATASMAISAMTASYLDAIRWWMDTRHGWAVEADQIFTTHGLVNGTGLCIDSLHRGPATAWCC